MVSIKPADLKEADSIAKLHGDSWSRHYRGIMGDAYLDNDNYRDKEKMWHERLSLPKSNQVVLVAHDDEELAGFCCGFLDDHPAFGSLIDNLHVDAGYQRTGLGRALLRKFNEHIIQSASSRKAYLWVYEQNLAAREAYKRLGGVIHETIEETTYDGSVSRICRVVWDELDV